MRRHALPEESHLKGINVNLTHTYRRTRTHAHTHTHIHTPGVHVDADSLCQLRIATACRAYSTLVHSHTGRAQHSCKLNGTLLTTADAHPAHVSGSCMEVME